MPSMANITVKKNDGATDIVYSAVVAAGGDKSPAVWRSNTIGTAPGQRPEMRLASRANGDSTARRLDLAFTYPSLSTDAYGNPVVTSRFNLTASMVVPSSMDDDDINEAVAQSMNLMASSLVKASGQSGYAPT